MDIIFFKGLLFVFGWRILLQTTECRLKPEVRIFWYIFLLCQKTKLIMFDNKNLCDMNYAKYGLR